MKLQTNIPTELDRILRRFDASAPSALNEKESKSILSAYGVPVVKEIGCKTLKEAVQAAKSIGFPVVLKGLSRKILHKTEAGMVHLNLTSIRSVRDAARQIKDRAGDALDGFLVQPQIIGRREFVAGMVRDNLFGPTIMFGLGGIFTEALADVSFRLAPLGEWDVKEMLDEIRAKSLLGPFRGEAPAKTEQLIQTLMGLSRCVTDYPDISEIDINPLVITPKGEVCAVDALIVMGDRSHERPVLPKVDPEKIRRFFHPRSIAFVGASSHFGKWGHILPSVTISSGFEGDIHLVNPNAETIIGRPVFKSLLDIPGTVDLGIVTVPAEHVLDLIPQFKEKGISNMLLVTSGFAETGDDGKALEDRLIQKAREAGILVLGPNTMGILNPHIRLFCTGSNVWPLPGNTMVVSQSGNLGTQILNFAEQQGIGIRLFSGSGNEAMITIEDYLEAAEQDELTQIIVIYLESVKNGRRFFELCRRVGKKKPILLLKGGYTPAGHRAAASHTGAIRSDSRIFDAVCRQTGIIKVEHPMELLDLAASLSSLPLPKGKRVAIVTLGGGWGVVTADICARNGIELPELSSELIQTLDRILPPYWSRSNPVDIVGESDDTIPMVALEELMKWDGCDAVLNLGIFGRKYLYQRYVKSASGADPTFSKEFLDALYPKFEEFENRYIEHIITLMETYHKPVLGVGLISPQDRTIHRIDSKQFNALFFPTPERAVSALARMWEYQNFLDGSSHLIPES